MNYKKNRCIFSWLIIASLLSRFIGSRTDLGAVTKTKVVKKWESCFVEFLIKC